MSVPREIVRLAKHQDSRENKTNWFPQGTDIKCFVTFLDFYFNSDKELRNEWKQSQYLKERI